MGPGQYQRHTSALKDGRPWVAQATEKAAKHHMNTTRTRSTLKLSHHFFEKKFSKFSFFFLEKLTFVFPLSSLRVMYLVAGSNLARSSSINFLTFEMTRQYCGSLHRHTAASSSRVSASCSTSLHMLFFWLRSASTVLRACCQILTVRSRRSRSEQLETASSL